MELWLLKLITRRDLEAQPLEPGVRELVFQDLELEWQLLEDAKSLKLDARREERI